MDSKLPVQPPSALIQQQQQLQLSSGSTAVNNDRNSDLLPNFGDIEQGLHSENTPLMAEGVAAENVDGPPSYFNSTIIPSGEVFYYEELNSQAFQEFTGSQATFTRGDKKCIKSHDPILDRNPNELFKFFLTHLEEPPQLQVHIVGTHRDTIHKHETYTDSHGNVRSRTVSESITVTDFDFKFDLSNYVSPQWSYIRADRRGKMEGCCPKCREDCSKDCARDCGRCEDDCRRDCNTECVCPCKEEEEVETIDGAWRAVLESYTRSGNWFKEIHLSKEVPFDYDGLKEALMRAIRWTSYPHSVTITFPKRNHKISVYSSNIMSQLAQNMCVRCLCVVSCLWVIALPIYALSRKKISGKLECIYQPMMSGEQFYERNAVLLVEAVRSGAKETTITAL
ncbi:hypothetical protein HDU76_003971 [Blyttiomyces sp. JEL0837]|nr:hypothetical protein HDU76_003971 [Blyttiomyces sp. JEL0837]